MSDKEQRAIPIRGRREPWRLPPPAPGQPNVVALVASRADPDLDVWSIRCPAMPGFAVDGLTLTSALRAAAQNFTDLAGPTVLRVEFLPSAFPHLDVGQHAPAIEPPAGSRRRR